MAICVIYGPVASGKLTTAKAFAELTGYTLFHNHMIQDLLVSLIPYERDDLRPQRALLSREIRKNILSTLLATDINIVLTMNYGGSGGLELLRFIDETAKKNSQPVYVARLMPSREELERRVISDSRKQHDKAHTVGILTRLLEGEGYGYEKFPDYDHFEIDNTDIPANEVAQRIISHYGIKERTKK